MIKRRLRAPFLFRGQGERVMQIDGQCHCGKITYEAEIDPEAVSVCHCTATPWAAEPEARSIWMCHGSTLLG